MTKSKKKRIIDRLTYAYIRRVKKWMFCPACQRGKMSINKRSTMWICKDCGYKLPAAEFEDDYVFWFCDECSAYINSQEGFNRQANRHICRNCGYENNTTLDNVKGICSDCGKVIPDPDGTLCVECRQERCRRAKEWLINAGKVVGVVATVAGVAYLASQSNDEEGEGYTAILDRDDGNDDVYGLGPGIYPYCKTCGTEMTEFDGWAWYTCPFCENSVRIIEGKETWYDEIFGKGKKSHHTDFELADFCRGGDLSED